MFDMNISHQKSKGSWHLLNMNTLCQKMNEEFVLQAIKLILSIFEFGL